MKTALVQTEFWKDEEVFQLNIDTKLLYLYLMTSPERNCTRFYRCPDRLISVYVGLSNEALEVCKKQLELSGLIYFKNGWVVIGNQSYVKPTKGKLSQKLLQEDLDKVPDEIMDFALSLNLDCSGAAQEYKDNNNNNNKDNNKAKDKDKDIHGDIGLKKKETLGSVLRGGE